jgi:hypothetical protein
MRKMFVWLVKVNTPVPEMLANRPASGDGTSSSLPLPVTLAADDIEDWVTIACFLEFIGCLVILETKQDKKTNDETTGIHESSWATFLNTP